MTIASVAVAGESTRFDNPNQAITPNNPDKTK